MRTFNPEKELKKIQKGNKNKVIFSIMALLLIIAIGSSYALYQIRYNKQIIYTTVAPFNKRDVYLAVKVNGEYQDKFPDQNDNYAFSGYECDGDATVTFDPDKWVAYVGATGPDKCTIKFGAKNTNYDEIRKKEDVVVDETKDVNLRYIGANPNNYIWFNCDSYENLTNDTAEDEEHNCEKWRIIGLMNNMTIVDEDTEEETPNQSLVKIIRAEKIGNISWDSSNKNNWAEASLQKGLNGPYLENTDKGDWITSGEYGSNNTLADNYKSITSSTLEMIENVKWSLGGCTTVKENTLEFYNCERNPQDYVSNSATWNGKIANIYISDYGFASNGSNNGKDRNTCLKTDMNPDFSDCSFKDWLKSEDNLYPLTRTVNDMAPYSLLGGTTVDRYGVLRAYAEFPTLYLNPNIKIVSGAGTSEEPYILSQKS